MHTARRLLGRVVYGSNPPVWTEPQGRRNPAALHGPARVAGARRTLGERPPGHLWIT